MRYLLIIIIMLLMLRGCAYAKEPTNENYAQELTSSWYSVESLKREGTWAYSHGMMANGKMFKDEGFTCATRLFPIGSKLRIISIASGKSVIVTVTDRIGKRFANKRIDLSKRAFSKIANINIGISKVRLEII